MASSESGRIPSLVSYCQRVLSAHADAITCLGDDIRYDVIKPVLECCSADTLLRLEQSSPYLEQDTSDLWERLCFKSYPLLAEQTQERPESWRDKYFLLREKEAHRLEEVASRLRNQRIEAAERKREREVKLTDRLPPAKRSRAWGSSSQPKSLFQKTKSEATKLQRSLYTRTTHTEVHRPIQASPSTLPSAKPAYGRASTKITPAIRSPTAVPPRPATNSIDSNSQKDTFSLRPLSPTRPRSQTTEPGSSKPQIQKRNPTASLFMPKHRALSQLPSQPGNNNRTDSA